MDIPNLMITINCSNGPLKIKLEKLLEYDYFKKALNNFKTRMTWDEKDVVINDISFTTYSFQIPHLEVDCTTHIFEILLGGSYCMDPLDGHKFNLQILLFADMYRIPVRIKYPGFIDSYEFIKYIKKKFPHLDSFGIIHRGGLINHNSLIENCFKLLAKNQLAPELIPDMTNYLEEYISIEYSVRIYSGKICDESLPLSIIKSIKYLWKESPDKTKNIVTNDKITRMLTIYKRMARGQYFDHATYRLRDECLIINTSQDCIIKQYNYDIDKILDEFALWKEIGFLDVGKLAEKKIYDII